MWRGCVGVFRSLLAGSLPMTVLWTSSSWGVSTAKDRWLAIAGKQRPASLSLSLLHSPSLFVSACLSRLTLSPRAFLSSSSRVTLITGKLFQRKGDCLPPSSTFTAKTCDAALPSTFTYDPVFIHFNPNPAQTLVSCKHETLTMSQNFLCTLWFYPGDSLVPQRRVFQETVWPLYNMFCWPW